MSVSKTYLVSVTPHADETSGATKKQENGKCSEKERLAMEREDYFFNTRERFNERRQTITLLNGEYSDLMRLLTSLSSVGIGALLFNQSAGTERPTTFWLAFVFMALSLLISAASYIFSIRSLTAWVKELSDLEKSYEEMEQISNDLLHFCIGLSGIFFLASCTSFLCYVAK